MKTIFCGLVEDIEEHTLTVSKVTIHYTEHPSEDALSERLHLGHIHITQAIGDAQLPSFADGYPAFIMRIGKWQEDVDILISSMHKHFFFWAVHLGPIWFSFDDDFYDD